MLIMIEMYRSLNAPLSILDVSSWMFSIALSFFLALFTIYKIYLKPKEIRELQKANAITWAASFILLGIANTLNLIWRYSIENKTTMLIVENLSVLFVNLFVIVKLVYTEYSINRYGFYKGYYFTFAFIGLTIFTSVLTPNTVREIGIYQAIYLILLVVGVSLFPCIFVYLAIKSKGEGRKMALTILIGYILLFFGLLLQPQNLGPYESEIPNFELTSNSLLILCPILISIAILVMFKSYWNNL